METLKEMINEIPENENTRVFIDEYISLTESDKIKFQMYFIQEFIKFRSTFNKNN